MTMDWDDLASSQLPTLGGGSATTATPSSYRYGQRTALGAGGTGATSSLLLPTHQQTLMHQQQPTAPPPPSPSAARSTPFPSLAAKLAQYEQDVVADILHRHETETRQRTAATMEAQLQAAWDVGSLDHRSSAMDSRGSSGSQKYHPHSNGHNDNNSHPPLLQNNAQLLQSRHSQSAAGAFRGNPLHATPLDGALVQAQWDIVRRSSRGMVADSSSAGTHASVVQHTIDSLATLASSASHNNNHRTSLDAASLGYRSAWHWMARLASRRGGNTAAYSGGSSGATNTTKTTTALAIASACTNDAVEHAKAALAHFSSQFHDVLAGRVRSAVGASNSAMTGNSNNNNNTDHPLVAQCKQFCHLELGHDDGTHEWSVLYYCLRCGDAVAAANVVPSIVSTLSNDDQAATAAAAVGRLVQILAQVQGSAATVWDSDTYLRLDESDRRTVATLYQNSMQQHSSSHEGSRSTPWLFQRGVYALLSGHGDVVTSDSVPGFKNIEDYLCGSLWKAVLAANPVEKLVALGARIQALGPSYFDDPSSGGWALALPLLASQQYRSALTWLASDSTSNPNGLSQAAHLALLMAQMGVDVQDLGPDSSDTVAPRNTKSSTVTSLLVAYSSMLLPQPGARAALDYLVHIPDQQQARKEVAKLIATTGEVSLLAGVFDAEGVRGGGLLAEHYTEQADITAILVQAADLLCANREDSQKMGHAVMCLMLAERYGDVLTLLNDLLSPPDKPNSTRAFWMNQISVFHSHYLSKRTHVVDVLEREDQMPLVRTSRILLDLNTFFDRFRQGSNDCWRMVEKLGLLPESVSDRRTKELAYERQDPMVQQAFPVLLVAALQLLDAEHGRLKRELSHDSTGVMQKRLHDIQEVANLYTSFAACAGIVHENTGQLTSLVSLMI